MSNDPRFRRLLEIRQALGKAAVKKLPQFIAQASPDGRCRSNLCYHGAGTGRWTAKGIQLQNLPSRGLAIEADEVPTALSMARLGMFRAVYDLPYETATACIRGLLKASPGHRFICADFSAIEGRVLAWMAGEMSVIDAYLDGKRLYCVAAAGIYHKPYDEIYNGRKHEPYKKMDAIGKVIELACGFQGSVGAFSNMASNYGVEVPEDEAREAITAWRESRPMTVALWRGLEQAAFQAVANPGTLQTYRDIRFKMVGKFLLMRLPSNRLLYYFNPDIVPKEMPWKDDDGNPVVKDVVSFWGVDGKTKRWMRQYGYGGLWTENAVQATARDLMAQAMLRLEAAGYPLILTIHDELLAEVPEGHGSVEDFVRIMTIIPPWAVGCPVTAEGWEGNLYRK